MLASTILRLKRSLRCGVLVAATLMAAVPASFAAEQTELRSFPPAYFEQFSPKSALDMVEQIPGFSISGGNNNGRGLGQAGGNVLINGARISGKSVSSRETLARIPAGNVLTLRIVDGASLSITGLSGDVLDVITRPSRFSGTWEWRPELRETQEPNLLRGKLSASGQIGKLTYSAGLDADADKRGDDGPEIVRDAAGEIFEIRQERYRQSQQEPEGTLTLRYDHSDDVFANFTAAYKQTNRNETESSDRTAITSRGVNESVLFDRSEDEREGEIGADITFPVGAGSLKLIGISGFEDSPVRRRIRAFDDAGDMTERREVYTQSDEGEQILRAEYSREIGGHDWQISAETAFNFVERTTQIFELENGAFAPIILDDPSVRVEEDRAEFALTHSRALTPNLDLQASIGVEQSTLTQSGNAANSREFVRPKGFANFSWTASPSLTVRFEIERIVDQLNFFDFISDVDLQDEVETDGNSELVPQQFWNFAAEIDKTFEGDNTVLLRVFYEDIEDLVTQVPLGEDANAVGNVDSASAYGVSFESTLRGDRWGYDGMQIDLEYFAQKTETQDPVTQETVRISDRLNTFYEVEFRHDVPGTDWAWGFGAQEERIAQAREPEEIGGTFSTGPFTDIFIERKDFYGMTANLKLLNLPNVKNGSRRAVFTGRRDTGVLDFTQNREQAYGRFLRLTLTGTF